jgi:hypothetical protein
MNRRWSSRRKSIQIYECAHVQESQVVSWSGSNVKFQEGLRLKYLYRVEDYAGL